MSDYQSFTDGFGIGSTAQVAELNKALTTGEYAQANGISAQKDGAAIQVESLENSLKVLTYNDSHVKLWKKISKSPAYSTVEEYNVLNSYGSANDFSAFVQEGVLPASEDSQYERRASFVKFLGITKQVTHPVTLVRSAIGDVIARETQNGIMWLMKQLENGLLWGDSTLANKGHEGVQFDGLNKLVEQTIDCRGSHLTENNINDGAEMILENYGTPTDLFLPYEVLKDFNEAYYDKQRILQPLAGSDKFKAGVVFNEFQTHGGSVSFNPNIFMQKTREASQVARTAPNAPTSKPTITCTAATGFGSKVTSAGNFVYRVAFANKHGEGQLSDPYAVEVNAGEVVNISAGTLPADAEYMVIYRSEEIPMGAVTIASHTFDGIDKVLTYAVEKVGQLAVGQPANYSDVMGTVANTYTAFMGEMTPEVITFKQLAPMMKMDLATVGPAYRWMQLIYGTPVLYMPKRWVKFKNIKGKVGTVAGDLNITR